MFFVFEYESDSQGVTERHEKNKKKKTGRVLYCKIIGIYQDQLISANHTSMDDL